MHLFIKSISGDYLTLSATPTASISSLCGQIEAKVGIPCTEQRLIYAGKQLSPQLTISDYGISSEATIDLTLRLLGGMKVTIIPAWDRPRVDLDIRIEDTIWDIKNRLISVIGGRPQELQFIYRENVLRNEETVVQSGLTDGAEIRVGITQTHVRAPSQ